MPQFLNQPPPSGKVIPFPQSRVVRHPADPTTSAYALLTAALVLAQHGAGRLNPAISAAFEAAGWQLPMQRLSRLDLAQQIILARAAQAPVGVAP